MFWSEIAFTLFLFHGIGLVVIDQPSSPFRRIDVRHLTDDVGDSRSVGFYTAGQRIASKRAEPHHTSRGAFTGLERKPLIVNYDEAAVALDDRAGRREVERHHRDFLLLDVAPHVELGPVGEREDPNGFARADSAIVDVPQFRPLVLRIPDMTGGTEGKDPFL